MYLYTCINMKKHANLQIGSNENSRWNGETDVFWFTLSHCQGTSSVFDFFKRQHVCSTLNLQRAHVLMHCRCSRGHQDHSHTETCLTPFFNLSLRKCLKKKHMILGPWDFRISCQYCWWFRNSAPPGMFKKPCKSWDKLPTLTGWPDFSHQWVWTSD